MIRSKRGIRRTALFGAVALFAGATAVAMIPGTSARGEDAPATGAVAFGIDPVHSAVVYRIKHMGVAYQYGRFNDISGTFLLDKAAPEKSIIDIAIKTASVDSANQGRDDAIRGPEFFNVEQFPTATFKSTSVKKTGDATFEVVGDFTLNGTTKPITVTVEHTGEGKGRGGSTVAGLETTFTFNRSDYSLGKPGGLGDDVRMVVSLEGGHK